MPLWTPNLDVNNDNHTYPMSMKQSTTNLTKTSKLLTPNIVTHHRSFLVLVHQLFFLPTQLIKSPSTSDILLYPHQRRRRQLRSEYRTVNENNQRQIIQRSYLAFHPPYPLLSTSCSGNRHNTTRSFICSS